MTFLVKPNAVGGGGGCQCNGTNCGYHVICSYYACQHSNTCITQGCGSLCLTLSCNGKASPMTLN